MDSQLQILAASLILATLTAGIGLLLQAKKMRRSTAAISSLEATGEEQERAVALLRAEVQRLQPFAQVACGFQCKAARYSNLMAATLPI